MKTRSRPSITTPRAKLTLSAEQIIADYRVAVRSRAASLLGRREVLAGRAKFGIFGDGKEVAQLAMAHAFRPGDFRSGYYRDQTFMFALGATDARGVLRPALRRRRRRRASRLGRPLDERATSRPACSTQTGTGATCSARTTPRPTCRRPASQMPRLVGLAWASQLYRELARAPRRRRRLLAQRRRDRLRHHRQRQLRRGHVLGVGQRRRRAAGRRC